MSISNILQPNVYDIYADNIGDTNSRVDDIWLNNINGQPYNPSPAPIPTLIPNKFLRTTNNISPTLFWGDVPATGIAHGTSNQILHTNNAGDAAEWTSDLIVDGALTSVGNGLFQQDLAVQNECNITNDLTVINGDLQVTVGNLNILNGDSTVQAIDINDQLKFANVAGTNNQIPVSNNLGIVSWQNPSFSPAAITPGLPNQVFVTNSAGTASQFSNNINLPGTLNVTGTSTLTGATNIVNNLQLNGSSGLTGQFIKKTGAATQAYSNISASDITAGANNTVLTSVTGVASWVLPTAVNRIKYVTTFNAQNLNAAAGPTAATFNTTPLVSIATTTVGSITGITQGSATQFTIGTTAVYDIVISGYIDPASTGLGNSIVTLSVEVAGVEQQSSCVVCNGNYSFNGVLSGIVISAASTVRILLRRVVGSNTLNTFAIGSALPSYASTIMFISN